MGQFSTGPINKAVPSFEKIVGQEYMNGDRRHFKHLFLFKKVFALNALSWKVETIYDNVSTAKLSWLKAA